MRNQCSIDLTPGVAHAKAYGFTSCIIFDRLHFMHGDKNAIVGAGKTRERRVTTTPDGISCAGDAKEVDSKLNFRDGGWFEDAVWSQPGGGRPKRDR